MFQSVNDLRRIMRRSLELIERSRIMLRELDIQGPTNLVDGEGSTRWGSGSST
jgi:hypothetical protein